MVEDAIELVAKGTLRQNAYLKDKAMKPAAEILDLCCGSGATGENADRVFFAPPFLLYHHR